MTISSGDRTVSPATAQIGELVVGVINATVGPVKLMRGKDNNTYLKLTLRITNNSKRPATYKSWSHQEHVLTLRDNTKNYYNYIKFSSDDLPIGSNPFALIEPGKTISDVLVFESLNNPVAYFELDLPYGGDAFKFAIPYAFTQREMLTMPSLPAPQVAPPPPPVAYDPTTDPSLIANLSQEYRAEYRDVERKTKGMGYDRARTFRRQGYGKIVSHLAEKYGLTEEFVRRYAK